MTSTARRIPPPVRITLKPGRDKAVRQGHPWLFSGAIAKVEGPDEAALAVVQTAKGAVLGAGFYSPRSQIRVRFLRHGPEATAVAPKLLADRLETARELREAVVPADTDGYRLLNAEGDGLPGWVIDRFGDVLVSQITVVGLDRLRDDAYSALGVAWPDTAVLQRNQARIRKREGLGGGDEWIVGPPRDEVTFRESGLVFTAELTNGQKTGFYLDQRTNRRLAERLASGRTMLDLFAHTGAFSAYGLRGDAASITAIESSGRLIERGEADLARNPTLATDRLSWVRANVFHDLRERQDRYGLVVCDPPSLVERRPHLDAGARAYKDLNRLALKRVADGGFLMTFSCSGAVDTKLFRQILFSAAEEAGVRASLLRPLAAGEDHPVDVSHLQGEYLKGWLVHVAGRR